MLPTDLNITLDYFFCFLQATATLSGKMPGGVVRVAAGSRNDFVVESKLTCTCRCMHVVK